MFAEVIEKYQSMKEKLSSNASIVHSPTFKNAIIMIHCRKDYKLSVQQRVAIKSLQVRGWATL